MRGYNPKLSPGAKIVTPSGVDDTIRINLALAEGGHVYLPNLGIDFIISDTLFIPSNTRLEIDPYARIYLANDSNDEMIQNSDMVNGNINIFIDGGIWDANNSNQTRDDAGGYIGSSIQLKNITGLILKNITLKDPVSFGIQVGDIHYFEIENITFDYNGLKPNMDGVHLNGLCDHGVIKNLQGTTYDDLLALNADDGAQYQLTQGEIYDIEVDGIFSTGGYRAVRILSGNSSVHGITIKNINGSYVYAAILFSNYAQGNSNIYDINITDVKATMTAANEGLIHIDTNIKNLRISGILRNQTGGTIYENVRITGGHTVNSLIITDMLTEDYTSAGLSLIYVMATATVGKFIIDKSIHRVLNGSNHGRLIVNRGVINDLVVSNSILDSGLQLIAVTSGGVLNNCQLANVKCSNLSYLVLCDTSSIGRISISNTYLNTLINIISLINATIGTVKIKTSCLSYENLSGSPINRVAQSYNYSGHDIPVDPSTFTAPTIGDSVVSNMVGKTQGLAWYNGTNWISVVDGSIIS